MNLFKATARVAKALSKLDVPEFNIVEREEDKWMVYGIEGEFNDETEGVLFHSLEETENLELIKERLTDLQSKLNTDNTAYHYEEVMTWFQRYIAKYQVY